MLGRSLAAGNAVFAGTLGASVAARIGPLVCVRCGGSAASLCPPASVGIGGFALDAGVTLVRVVGRGGTRVATDEAVLDLVAGGACVAVGWAASSSVGTAVGAIRWTVAVGGGDAVGVLATVEVGAVLVRVASVGVGGTTVAGRPVDDGVAAALCGRLVAAGLLVGAGRLVAPGVGVALAVTVGVGGLVGVGWVGVVALGAGSAVVAVGGAPLTLTDTVASAFPRALWAVTLSLIVLPGMADAVTRTATKTVWRLFTATLSEQLTLLPAVVQPSGALLTRKIPGTLSFTVTARLVVPAFVT